MVTPPGENTSRNDNATPSANRNTAGGGSNGAKPGATRRGRRRQSHRGRRHVGRVLADVGTASRHPRRTTATPASSAPVVTRLAGLGPPRRGPLRRARRDLDLRPARPVPRGVQGRPPHRRDRAPPDRVGATRGPPASRPVPSADPRRRPRLRPRRAASERPERLPLPPRFSRQQRRLPRQRAEGEALRPRRGPGAATPVVVQPPEPAVDRAALAGPRPLRPRPPSPTPVIAEPVLAEPTSGRARSRPARQGPRPPSPSPSPAKATSPRSAHRAPTKQRAHRPDRAGPGEAGPRDPVRAEARGGARAGAGRAGRGTEPVLGLRQAPGGRRDRAALPATAPGPGADPGHRTARLGPLARPAHAGSRRRRTSPPRT